MTNLQVLTRALRDRHPVSCVYDAKERTIYPHAIGVTKTDNLVVRAWQTLPEPGWRLLILDGMTNLVEDTATTFDVADGYKPGDRGMVTIIAELELEKA